MALSHYRNSRAAMNKWEVVNPSLFEVTIISPLNGSVTADSSLLLEHVRSISGLDGLNPAVGVARQKFKFAERSYAGGPDQTHLELGITFSLNLSDVHENYIYTALRNWTNLIYNPADGSQGLKVGYCGTMVIVEYNRDGSVWRKITCKDIFPTGQVTGLNDDNYDSVNDAKELQVTFNCDYWDEETIGLPAVQ